MQFKNKYIPIMRIMNLPALAILIIVSAGCTKDPGNNTTLTIEDMLVKNNEITGWVYSGSGWIANNGSELTQQINGGAELYIKYGFTEAASQLYHGTINDISCELGLTVYNLGTAENAVALFEDPTWGWRTDMVHNPAGTVQYIQYCGFLRYCFFDNYLVYFLWILIQKPEHTQTICHNG
jgi:hypothetical protein